MKIKIEDYILLGGTQVVQWESIATQTPFFTGFFASQNYSVSAPLRSAQNRRPPDVVRPITCFIFFA